MGWRTWLRCVWRSTGRLPLICVSRRAPWWRRSPGMFHKNDTTATSTCPTKGKGKGKGLDTCYSATYMSQTRGQQRFTISEVAADWHEPMVPQRIMWPSIARVNGQLHAPTVQLADTPSPQSATLGLHPVAVIFRPAEGRRLSWPEHTVG